MDSNLMWLVSLLKEESWTPGEPPGWVHGGKTQRWHLASWWASPHLGEGGASEETLILDFSLQNFEKVNFYCRSHRLPVIAGS